jgi:hypothetical protein
VAALSATAALVLGATHALAHGGQHPSGDNHLAGNGAWGGVTLIGKAVVNNAADDRVADVAALGNFAYLGAYAQDSCAGNEGVGPDGGVYVIDITNPANPAQAGFIKAHQDTFVGEGVQALSVNTPTHKGDILVMNNESCGKNYKGGFSIWDISNPRKPFRLSENVGDYTTSDQPNRPHDANQIHSVFAWQAGNKVYMVIVDDDEAKDVDIFDITNPRKPVFVTEISAPEKFDLNPQRANGNEVFLHDMIVKKIGTKYYMLMSYWDAGWIVADVTNPANPIFIKDHDYPDPDPLVKQHLSLNLSAEGNAHQAEWNKTNKFIIGTDEDFSPFRAEFEITSGPNAGPYTAGEFGFTKQIALTLPDGKLNGPTIFGGYACAEDADSIPDASVIAPQVGLNEEKILVVSRGPVDDPSANFEACFFDVKVANAAAKGYDAVVVANHHVGSNAGADPDAAFCGSGSPRDIMGVCIGHRALHLLFNTTPDFSVPYVTSGGTEPAIGTIGAKVAFTTTFDGWGYVRLLNGDLTSPNFMKELGQYAIPESFEFNKAAGYGALSVHEVATDPDMSSIGYLSYYAGGFRVIKFGSTGIQEVGGYLDPLGNDFWGVEVHKHPNGQKYILGSDMDSGLWIFQYTPQP